MQEYVATVTSKGQLTLPIDVRRRLGIDPGDRVTIVIDDRNGATLRRMEHDVRSVFGLIPTPPGLESANLDDLAEEAMLDRADRVIGRMRGEEE